MPIPDFEARLDQYADVIIKVGLNLQPGQPLIINNAPLESAPFVRKLVIRAYQAGASLVETLWLDEIHTLLRLQYAPRDSFEAFPAWRAAGLAQNIRAGGALLSIAAQNPDLLSGQDPDLITTMRRSAARHSQELGKLISNNASNWLVISTPTRDWARKVFPDAPEEELVDRLWEMIFQLSRIGSADPVAAWRLHTHQLASRAHYLTNKAYTALHYTAPGTDLTIGLPAGHIWEAGESFTQSGIKFCANIPTEEVFTLADRARVDGVISASMPLNYGGLLIQDFSLTFADGRVSRVVAREGQQLLEKLVETDDGAARLGEVALVPHSSPISQSGRMFYNTLYDENASSHLALGRAYTGSLKGGDKMSDEEFKQAGGNSSLIHVDFMVGSGKMDIDGLCQDGSREALMRQGEWVVEL